ncbi:MAG: hypothetical protein J7623_06355 [Chitinophaga sp.]|uniref:hypothetical protein n=1 Tax=Chitinophaga sp. TaxID=1869181 RepID=UPI001B19B902|nr:hypothetical protein [Chitinophaga sp.]MBO9728244.1 hypothetical protein [Chitinophaga sp.]
MNTFAQNHPKDPRYKQYAGKYGDNSGICLFEDGQFLMYGYATMVFGTYLFEKDYLLFTTDKPALFEVYAHAYPNRGDSVRINFVGFQEGNNFVQFDNSVPQRVFNPNANCFDPPFVYEAAKAPHTFTLAALLPEGGEGKEASNTFWSYQADKGMNDFVFVHNPPKRVYEDFRGMLIKTNDGETLLLSNYGGKNGYRKNTTVNEEEQAWVLSVKREYNEAKQHDEGIAYGNRHYRFFPEADLSTYTFDAASNQYTSKQAAENEGYYRSNQYKDDRYLRKYVKLLPATMRREGFDTDKAAAGSIFFSTCGEGSEKSYHYNGYIKYDNPAENVEAPVPTTAPIIPGTE